MCRWPQEVLTLYSQRVTILPSSEKIADVRALLVQRVKTTQASGQQVALAELVAGRHTPEFTVTLLFSDLAAFEAMRKRNQSDAAFQKFAAKLASLVRKPVAIELFEIVVQMPGMSTPSVAVRAKRKAK